jgi:hypothetical protein
VIDGVVRVANGWIRCLYWAAGDALWALNMIYMDGWTYGVPWGQIRGRSLSSWFSVLVHRVGDSTMFRSKPSTLLVELVVNVVHIQRCMRK